MLSKIKDSLEMDSGCGNAAAGLIPRSKSISREFLVFEG